MPALYTTAAQLKQPLNPALYTTADQLKHH